MRDRIFNALALLPEDASYEDVAAAISAVLEPLELMVLSVEANKALLVSQLDK